MAGGAPALLDGPTPDDWYYVQTGDQTGWAYGGLLALDGAGDGLDQASSWAVDSVERWVDVERTTQTVTLYEGDSRGGDVLGSNGERLVG